MRLLSTIKANRKVQQLLALLGILLCTTTYAQTSTYTFLGSVTDGVNSMPLPGATVSIENTFFGTVTNFDGNYSFVADLNAGDYTLVVSFIGFKTQRLSITIDSTSDVINNFSLSEDLLNLDEVVVTGNIVSTNKRQLGNAISTVKGEELQDNGSIAIDQALAGKITGALVQQNSGDPSGGISIRLRGPSTVAGSSDPLYIVDGIFVNNDSNEVIDLGGNTQNRLSDINPNDIERIEVIKGAAAAAIYGSRASNGVVQIFTKRGRAGETKYSFSANYRVNTLRKKIDYNQVPLQWENIFDNDDLSTVPVERYDLQDEIFETSTGFEAFLSASGGTDKTKYFLSGSFLNNGGIVKSTNFQRFGFKATLEQKASDWLTLTGSFNYTRSESDDIPNGGINDAYGVITGFLFSDNSVNPAPNESGVYPDTSLLVPRTNPAEGVNRFDFGQIVNRAITSIGATAKITKNLSANYLLGLDYYNQSGTGYIPPGNTSPFSDGFARRADVNLFQYNSDLNFSYNANIDQHWTSATVLGGSYQFEQKDFISSESIGLSPIVQVTSSDTGLSTVFESRNKESFWGTFLQQTFGFNVLKMRLAG